MRRLVIGLPILALSLVACGASPEQRSSNDAPAAGGSVSTNTGGTAPSTGGGSAVTVGGSSSEGGSIQGGTDNASGGASNGAAANGGSASGGSSNVPHVVGECDDLAEKGEWEEVSPPIDLNGGSGFGVNAFGLDPNVTGTLYVGTSSLGIWKSMDCGASYVHINTGENSPTCPAAAWTNKTCAELLDTGRQWAMIVDPSDSNVVYTSNGYGEGIQGALKSTNGGVDWVQIWPDNAPEFADQAPGALGDFKMDPGDPKHLAVSFHAECTGPSGACFAESFDSGDTWSLIWGMPGWGGEKGFVYIPNSSELFLGTEGDGLWRTTDKGATFNQLTNSVAHSPGGFYRSPNGSYYLGSSEGVLRSENGDDWALVPNSGALIGGVVGDGTTLYISTYAVGFKWGDDLQLYYTSPENDGTVWSQMTTPGMEQGGSLAYDPDHHLLYSGNAQQGLWRVVVE